MWKTCVKLCDTYKEGNQRERGEMLDILGIVWYDININIRAKCGLCRVDSGA